MKIIQKFPFHFKSTIYLVILIISLTLSIIPVGATDSEGYLSNPTVMITDYKVEPSVLLPGDKGTVTFTIKNTAQSASLKENSGIASSGVFQTSKSTDINVYIERVHLDGKGVTILTEDIDRLGSLGPGQSVPVTFVIKVPDNEGIYFPEAWIDVKEGRSTRYPLTVNVNTDISTQKKPALRVYQNLPERIAPGENCAVDISIENTGLIRASDITVAINSTTKSLVLTSPGRYYFEHLNPGEIAHFSLNLSTDKNTPLGIDPVTILFTYQNPDNSIEKQTETVGIPVKGRAEISIKSVSTDPVTPVGGSSYTLVTRIENTGTDRATSVKAILDGPFEGSKTAFVGSIDKNSDSPAVFNLQNSKEGNTPANLTIVYQDDFGTHQISDQATVVVKPSSILGLVIALLLICGLIGGVLYRSINKRPGHSNGE